MLKIALYHFKTSDPKLNEVGERVKLKHGDIRLEPTQDPFTDLCDAIVGQQLSGKAAQTIFERFKNLFPRGRPTAKKVLETPTETLRNCGMSYAKVASVKDLATKALSGEVEINLNELEDLSEEDIIKMLTKVKGIGPWTVEMFLMFSLAREDVFSLGDLGLKKAIKNIYYPHVGSEGFLPPTSELLRISEKWKPFRTYASMILWKSLDL